jgi:hypothetical protein
MIGLDLSQFKYQIVTPTLQYLGAKYDSAAAINLVTGTALVESALTYVLQLPDGPATSLWQEEEPTYDDIMTRAPREDSSLGALINAASYGGAPSYAQLVTNLKLGAIVCRLKYWLIEAPLPAATDATGMADYHKTWYNTSLGAANAAANVADFQTAIST